LLPFTPWTTRNDVVELLDFVARTDCVANVDPVHYSIRLLIPPGSLILGLDDPALVDALGPYDPVELGFRWRSADPLLDDLQRELARLIESVGAAGLDTDGVYDLVRACVFDAFGATDPGRPDPETALGPAAANPNRPRLSESWFCCAEPTATQLGTVTDAATDPLEAHQWPVLTGTGTGTGTGTDVGSGTDVDGGTDLRSTEFGGAALDAVSTPTPVRLLGRRSGSTSVASPDMSPAHSPDAHPVPSN
jgi:hypothetical protein